MIIVYEYEYALYGTRIFARIGEDEVIAISPEAVLISYRMVDIRPRFLRDEFGQVI